MDAKAVIGQPKAEPVEQVDTSSAPSVAPAPAPVPSEEQSHRPSSIVRRPSSHDQIALAGAGLGIGAIWLAVIWYSCGGHLSAALDDTFIHLQYAQQIAAGHFFAYNTADGYSSGATSVLYVLVLAGFAMLGAQGDGLLWVAHLLNIALFAASAVLAYRLGRRWAGRAAGWAAGGFFLLNGLIIWGYGSGMEIGLFSFLLLAALLVLNAAFSFQLSAFSKMHVASGNADPSPSEGYATLNTHYSLLITRYSALITFVVLAALALMRPEALAMVGEAGIVLAWRAWKQPGRGGWGPVAAAGGALLIGLLPLGLDLIFTGRVTPNAAAAKLILYRYPDIHPLHIAFIWARTFTQMVSEIFLHARTDSPFILYAFILAALGGFRRAAAELLRGKPGGFTIGAAWLLTNWALAATLQPVQQYRYLIASYPLFTVFMAVGMADLARWVGGRGLGVRGWRSARNTQHATRNTRRARAVFLGLATIIAVSSVGNAVDEIVALGENSADIYGQQVALGHWIAATLPADARIAINDAGAMKYYGGRYMYDLVGLTTNGLAGLRHLGDGPIYNWLTALPPAQRPNYFIIYPDWFPDLSALPGFLTAVHSVHLPHNTIASEADVPVYEVHWDALRAAPQPQLDHSADDVEVPSGKVVFTGAPGPGPYYLAHLALTTAQTVTLRLEPDAGAQLDYVDLAEDISGYTVRLPAGHGGSQISQTISLPAGSYRLSAGGHFGPGAGVIVRLLTPGPLLGLPGHTPAPPRRLVDEVDLGNLASEAAHDYTMDPWQWNIYPEAILRSATYTSQPATPYVDTGRSVPGAQEFTVATQPGQPLQVVLRYLSAVPQRVQVQVDGQDAGLWYYPAAAGWGEAQLLLPARLIQHAQTRLRFAVLQDPADTPMQSFRFWFYQ